MSEDVRLTRSLDIGERVNDPWKGWLRVPLDESMLVCSQMLAGKRRCTLWHARTCHGRHPHVGLEDRAGARMQGTRGTFVEGCVNERTFPMIVSHQSRVHFRTLTYTTITTRTTHTHLHRACVSHAPFLPPAASLPVDSAHDWIPRTTRAGPCSSHPRHFHITGTFPP